MSADVVPVIDIGSFSSNRPAGHRFKGDPTNRVDAAAGNQPHDDCNPPAQGSVGALGQAEKNSESSVEKPEPALDDRSLARLRDEKAARFAIACFLAQQ